MSVLDLSGYAKGYQVDLDEKSIVTPKGFKLDEKTLTDVSSIYDRLVVANKLKEQYNLSSAIAWNSACDVCNEVEYNDNLSKMRDGLVSSIIGEIMKEEDREM